MAFFRICINSSWGQEQIESFKGAKTTKQTELGVKNLGNFVLPLPPIAEQEAIVDKVEELGACCERLEQQVTQSRTTAEELMQTVLREAFTMS